MTKVRIEGRAVDVLDPLCAYRSCLRPCEWKGVLTPGRGYQYAPRSSWYWMCRRRADYGCPDPLPEPDPAKARCCDTPRVRGIKHSERPPRRQRCINCGAWLQGVALEVARNE